MHPMDTRPNWAKTDNDGWWFRVGGFSAIIIGLAYLVIIGLYAVVGAPPVGGEAWLNYLVGKTSA